MRHGNEGLGARPRRFSFIQENPLLQDLPVGIQLYFHVVVTEVAMHEDVKRTVYVNDYASTRYVGASGRIGHETILGRLSPSTIPLNGPGI